MFFEHKKLYRSIKEDVPDADYTVPLLKSAIRREGHDLTAISYGYTMQLTLQAAEQMRQKHGVEVEVVDLRTLAPLDSDTFLESVAKTSRAGRTSGHGQGLPPEGTLQIGISRLK
jgi:pyruvate/2-oxoglutarate/acetoin dehydrogenase E1 component